MNQTEPNEDSRNHFRVERRLVEDVWRFERKWLSPRMPKPATVPIPADENMGQDLTDFYAEDTFQEMDMGDIDQDIFAGFILSKRQFMTIVALLMVLAFVVAFLATFVDIKHLPQNIIKHLY